jgi:hypothetical protein
MQTNEHCVTNEQKLVMTTGTLKTPPKYQGAKLPDFQAALVEVLYEDLQMRHGPILGGGDLAKAMGYRSLAAFRQARRRGQVEVALFSLPHRRGVFALGLEVAKWLAHASHVNRAATTQEGNNTSPN